jgi:dihydroneopterin aldolase/2-amino-4-hydroxy-6-hydroxymethyldihydropteridine diphosphokinase
VSAPEPVRIELRGLAAVGPHGVTAAEREAGCRIVADLTLTLDACAATGSDELADTVDYAEVAAEVTGTIRERSCHTLERLAAVIADRIAERWSPDRLEVRLAKPEPPMPEEIGEVAVTLRR